MFHFARFSVTLLGIVATTGANCRAEDSNASAARFDAASKELLGSELLRIFGAGDDDSRRAADRQLRALLTLSFPGGYQPPEEKRNLVLFVVGGDEGGDKWLVFAYLSDYGLELFSVLRGAPDKSCCARLTPIGAPWNNKEPNPKIIASERRGNTIVVWLQYLGGLNRVEWSLERLLGPNPPKYMEGPPPKYLRIDGRDVPIHRLNDAEWTGITARPRTGWTFDWVGEAHWWPDTHGFRLLESDQRPEEIYFTRASAVAFLHDRDLVAATNQHLIYVDVAKGEVETKTYPIKERRDWIREFRFSPNGTRLFAMSGTISAHLIDVESATAVTIPQAIGLKGVSFLDEDTLLWPLVGFVRMDWKTQLVKPEPTPITPTMEFDVAAGRIVFAKSESEERRVRVADMKSGKELASFEPISGLHQLSISPDGTLIAQKGQSGLMIGDIATGRVLWEHDGHNDLHTSPVPIRWTPDGRYGMTVGCRYIYLWSVADKWVTRIRHERKGGHPGFAISNDGRRLAVVAPDSDIAYWPEISTIVPADPDPPPAASTNRWPAIAQASAGAAAPTTRSSDCRRRSALQPGRQFRQRFGFQLPHPFAR